MVVQGRAFDGAFHPTGKQIAIASGSGVHVFDSTLGEVLAESKMEDDIVGGRFTPDGSSIITGTHAGLRIWPVDRLAAALRLKPRELTDAECKRYGISNEEP